MAGEFIGRGWAFPIRTDATGAIALVGGQRELEESMRLILGTAPGERPMRPEFGCGIHEHVFATADATTAGRIGYEVRAALSRWEPRVDVVEVTVTPDDRWPATLLIDIAYSIRETNEARNLVFPFYTIPAESEPDLALPVGT